MTAIRGNAGYYLIAGTLAAVVLLLATPAGSVTPAGAESVTPEESVTPTEAVAGTVRALVRTLEDEALAAPGRGPERRARLREDMDERFDFAEMARRSLAAEWKVRTPAEREEFVALYTGLLERTYIKKIESYKDEEIVYLGQRVKGAVALVRTKLVDDDGLEVAISYRLHNKRGPWEVYDVIIEGVSLVNNYRTQFRSILKDGSYEDLLKKLRKKSQKEDG